MNVICILTVPPTGRPPPRLSPSPGAALFPESTILKLGQLITLQWPCERKSKSIRKNCIEVLFQETATATSAFSNHLPDQSAANNIEANPSISKKITTR
jgi:hypothetical protein